LNDSLKEMAMKAPGFDKIKDDERFKKLVAWNKKKLRNSRLFWECLRNR
jgi:hypothetical protein